MTARTPTFPSKTPHIGTTIFTVMSALAAEKQAVNLGQGFPDFDCDPKLVDGVTAAMREGLNQYPPMTGVAPLREAVSAKIEALYGRRYDPVSEITVTAGATQAILTIILATVHAGDDLSKSVNCSPVRMAVRSVCPNLRRSRHMEKAT